MERVHTIHREFSAQCRAMVFSALLSTRGARAAVRAPPLLRGSVMRKRSADPDMRDAAALRDIAVCTAQRASARVAHMRALWRTQVPTA